MWIDGIGLVCWRMDSTNKNDLFSLQNNNTHFQILLALKFPP